MMKKAICFLMTVGALTAFLLAGCGDSGPAGPGGGGGGDDPTRLPAIPIPDDVNSILPEKSEEIDVGLSRPMLEFEPVVAELEQMLDDGSTAWTVENRRLMMVCGTGLFSEYSCDTTLTDRRYVSASPRLLHKRYWRRLKQVILDPGTSYSKTETVEYGSSTTNTLSQSFSQTIGVEVSASAGWGAFSATVTASYEQTSTREEVNSVTFSETSTFSEEYSVQSDPGKTIVYALWQLVDVFMLVDENKVPMHQSDTLVHVTIPAIPRVEFLNRDVVRQSVTRFDPPARGTSGDGPHR